MENRIPEAREWPCALIAVIACVGMTALSSCDRGESADNGCEQRSDYDDTDTVCCESYGLGDTGECCFGWEWSVASDCAPPDGGLDGGGRVVVVDSCCEGP